MRGAGLWASVVALVLLGCGKTNRDPADVGEPELEACETDADCGALLCACGFCRAACNGATVCDAEPADSCVDPEPEQDSPRQTVEYGWDGMTANDFAVSADGTVSVVGNMGDPKLWAARLDGNGQEIWQFLGEGSNATGRKIGLSLALTPGDEILTLVNVFDALHGAMVQRLDATGFPRDNWWAVSTDSTWGGAYYTTVRSNGAGPLWATGSVLLGTTAGETARDAWIGRFDDDPVTARSEPTWQKRRQGAPGSASDITVSSLDQDGNLVVGGYLGEAAYNNASTPYFARLDPDGNFVWEVSETQAYASHCEAGAVAFTRDGGALTATDCSTPLLRAYDATGALQWERRPARTVTALAGLANGDYLVALGAPGDATLQLYDVFHRLLWRVTEPGAQRFAKVVATDRVIIALAQTELGFKLRWFENEARFVVE